MRFGIVAALGLMAAVSAVGAQQAKTSSSASTAQLTKQVETIQASMDASACPGQLTAQQKASGGQTVWTTSQNSWNAQSDGNKPGLGVRVAFQGAKTIRSLELRVSYLPPGLRFIPTDVKQTAMDMRESDKTFVLQEKDGLRVVGDLLVGPAATITRVHLMSVTYADGSVWHPSNDEQCSVVPNRVMEVAAK